MIRSLLARRVPQLTGIYLIASWGFVQFVDWAVNQYALSPAITNFVVTLLLLLLPSVLLIAWRHGAPGADTWTRTDGEVTGSIPVGSIGYQHKSAVKPLFLLRCSSPFLANCNGNCIVLYRRFAIFCRALKTTLADFFQPFDRAPTLKGSHGAGF